MFQFHIETVKDKDNLFVQVPPSCRSVPCVTLFSLEEYGNFKYLTYHFRITIVVVKIPCKKYGISAATCVLKTNYG